MGRVSLQNMCVLLNDCNQCSSEDEPMDQDDEPKAPKQNDDDLAKYKLDDYDKESTSIGECCLMQISRNLKHRSCWAI